jgi:hypothetical protein
MNENSPTNQSAIELRLKQVIRYVSLALCGILALCLLLFVYIGSVKQSERTAVDQSQAQAQTAIQSDLCQVYPATDVCEMSREILSNPQATVVPKDGTDGKDGQNGTDGADGRGVTSFDQSSGELVVTYTDGQTKNLGRVVGKDGAQGIQGLTGRGILSTALQNGNLIVNYTDGTSETLGYIVGPAGATGAAGQDGASGKDGTNGTNGVDGAPGRDGISVTGVTLDNTNSVIVSYSDGRTETAGQLVINTIKFMQCQNDTLTIGMVDGTAFTTTVDCTPDNLPAAIPNPIKP